MQSPLSMADGGFLPPNLFKRKPGPGTMVEVILGSGEKVIAKIVTGKKKGHTAVMYTDENGRKWRYNIPNKNVVGVKP